MGRHGKGLINAKAEKYFKGCVFESRSTLTKEDDTGVGPDGARLGV